MPGIGGRGGDWAFSAYATAAARLCRSLLTNERSGVKRITCRVLLGLTVVGGELFELPGGAVPLFEFRRLVARTFRLTRLGVAAVVRLGVAGVVLARLLV